MVGFFDGVEDGDGAAVMVALVFCSSSDDIIALVAVCGSRGCWLYSARVAPAW